MPRVRLNIFGRDKREPVSSGLALFRFVGDFLTAREIKAGKRFKMSWFQGRMCVVFESPFDLSFDPGETAVVGQGIGTGVRRWFRLRYVDDSINDHALQLHSALIAAASETTSYAGYTRVHVTLSTVFTVYLEIAAEISDWISGRRVPTLLLNLIEQ